MKMKTNTWKRWTKKKNDWNESKKKEQITFKWRMKISLMFWCFFVWMVLCISVITFGCLPKRCSWQWLCIVAYKRCHGIIYPITSDHCMVYDSSWLQVVVLLPWHCLSNYVWSLYGIWQFLAAGCAIVVYNRCWGHLPRTMCSLRLWPETNSKGFYQRHPNMAARVVAEVAYPGHFVVVVSFLSWVGGWEGGSFQPSVLDCGQKLIAKDLSKASKHGSQSSCWGCLPRTFCCGGEFLVLGRWVRGWVFSAVSLRLRPEISNTGFYRRHQTWQPE